MATSTFCAVSVAAPLADVAKLSSGNAFRASTSSVQLAPVNAGKAIRPLTVRAGLSEQKTARREVLASIFAAGAAFTVAGGAFAGPLEDAKSKVDEAIAGVKSAAPDTSDAGKALEDAKKKADSSFGGATDKLQNLKPVGNNFQRPVNKELESAFGKKAGELSKKAGSVGSDLQSKGDEAKSSVQGSVPDIPKPDTGNLFGSLQGFNKAAQSKVDEAKGSLGVQ